jgi:outer membrane biosynthesis protein TonB
MDIRFGGRRYRYDFDALNARVFDAAWPWYRRMDWRGRMGAAVAFAIILHLFLLWALLAEHPHAWDISHSWETEDQPLPVDMWTPLETRPQPVEKATSHPAPVHETPPQPQPQPKTQPQPVPLTAPPQPVETPQAKPEVVIEVPAPNSNPLPSAAATPVFDAPREMPMSLSTKKKDKKDDVQKLDTTVGRVSDLNLHQVATDAPVLDAVPPSGLTPSIKAGGAAAGAQGGGAGAGAASGGLNGTGLKGRGAISQALQDHDYCVDKQINGKTIPADCHMPDMASAKSLGLKHVADYDAELARRRMIAQPGNADYWNRVNTPIADPAHDDHRPRPGQYHDGKAARVMGECSQTDSCPSQ